MVEAINQSGARIFLGVKIEEIVARGMKRISLHVLYSAANDPQTENDPQIGPQMIPDEDRK